MTVTPIPILLFPASTVMAITAMRVVPVVVVFHTSANFHLQGNSMSKNMVKLKLTNLLKVILTTCYITTPPPPSLTGL